MYRLRKIFSDFKIAHMGIDRTDEYCSKDIKKCYPVGIKWFGDDLYIVNTTKEYKNYLGYKITEIEGMNIKDVLKKYDDRYCNETDAYLKSCFEADNSYALGKVDLDNLGIKKNENKYIEVNLNKDGKNVITKIKEIEIDNNNPPEFVSIYDDMKNIPIMDKVYQESQRAPFTYMIDEENKSLYFQYNRCVDRTTDKNATEFGNFQDFFDKMISELKRNEGEIDKIVIDLRNNTGGSELLMNTAVETYKEELKRYPVKILIGMNTFSAGVDAIDTLLYSLNDVELYGSETGMAIHNYTEVKQNVLKNTGCTIYTTAHEDTSMAIDKRAKDISKGVLPDVEIEEKYDDFIQGKDDAYGAERAHIHSQHNSIASFLLSQESSVTGLSEIQKQLLSLLFNGRSDKEIGETLGIAQSTVRNHRFKLREKEKQAKLFLALMDSIANETNKPIEKRDTGTIQELHTTATMVDDRYSISDKEREKTISTYMDENGALKQFPAKEKKKIILLAEIIKNFKSDTEYSEYDVNKVLKRIYEEDYPTIRRALIEYGFMDRSNDCKVYRVK